MENSIDPALLCATTVNGETIMTSTEPVTEVRVLLEQSASKPMRHPREKPWYPMVVGEMKFRLQLSDGVFLDYVLPPQRYRWYTEFYNSFKGRFWTMKAKEVIKNPKHKWNYACLICDKVYSHREFLTYHLNQHMGYYIARCQLCPARFYSLRLARSHQKQCLKKMEEKKRAQ